MSTRTKQIVLNLQYLIVSSSFSYIKVHWKLSSSKEMFLSLLRHVHHLARKPCTASSLKIMTENGSAKALAFYFRFYIINMPELAMIASRTLAAEVV